MDETLSGGTLNDCLANNLRIVNAKEAGICNFTDDDILREYAASFKTNEEKILAEYAASFKSNEEKVLAEYAASFKINEEKILDEYFTSFNKVV